MNEKTEKGSKAEDLAAEYLSGKGYKVLERNWRSGHREIDIIAESQNRLVIVEVKARSDKNAETPAELLSRQKMRFLADAAEDYIFKKNILMETRFDMISIIFSKNERKIEHIESVFIPGVNW